MPVEIVSIGKDLLKIASIKNRIVIGFYATN